MTHRPPNDGRAAVGYLFVECRRHVDRWQNLTQPEANALASAAWTASRVLATRFATEHVFSALVGLGVPHVHQHVFVRHPGTPSSVPWTESATWSGAPTVPSGDLRAVAADLAGAFAQLAAES